MLLWGRRSCEVFRRHRWKLTIGFCWRWALKSWNKTTFATFFPPRYCRICGRSFSLNEPDFNALAHLIWKSFISLFLLSSRISRLSQFLWLLSNTLLQSICRLGSLWFFLRQEWNYRGHKWLAIICFASQYNRPLIELSLCDEKIFDYTPFTLKKNTTLRKRARNKRPNTVNKLTMSLMGLLLFITKLNIIIMYDKIKLQKPFCPSSRKTRKKWKFTSVCKHRYKACEKYDLIS